MSAANRLPVTAIRPPTVYGPRDRTLLKYFRAVKAHLRPYLGAAKPFSIVYAEDHARAVWEALTQDRAVGQIYFVAGPDLTTYEEMGNEIARAMGTWALKLRIPSLALLAGALVGEAVGAATRRPPFLSREKLREITAGAWIVSSRKIREQLDWAPATGLEQGTRATAGWYREAGWV